MKKKSVCVSVRLPLLRGVAWAFSAIKGGPHVVFVGECLEGPLIWLPRESDLPACSGVSDTPYGA